MKVGQEVQETVFQPVTITLESEVEVLFITKLLGGLTGEQEEILCGANPGTWGPYYQLRSKLTNLNYDAFPRLSELFN